MEWKAFAALVLTALGIVAPLPEFLAGMLLALGGAYGAMLVAPPATRASLKVTLFLALLAGIGATYVHRIWLDGFPVQALMFLGGALSRWIAGALHSFGAGLQERAGRIPGGVKLPWEGGGDDR